MTRENVTSTAITAMGWENNVLEVEFPDGGVYQYQGVSESEYTALKNSASIGSTFHSLIRGRYTPTRLPDPVAA